MRKSVFREDSCLFWKGKKEVGCLGYADDLTYVTHNVNAPACIMNVLREEAKYSNLWPSDTKSVVMMFNGDKKDVETLKEQNFKRGTEVSDLEISPIICLGCRLSSRQSVPDLSTCPSSIGNC